MRSKDGRWAEGASADQQNAAAVPICEPCFGLLNMLTEGQDM